MDWLWRFSMRQWVVIVMITFFVLSVRILWPFLTPLSLSLLLTYILIPVVNRVEEQSRWPRPGATAFVYLVLLIIIALIPALVVPVIVQQVQVLIPLLGSGINELGELIAGLGTITLLGQEVNPHEMYVQKIDQLSDQLIEIGTQLATSSFTFLFGFATTFVSTVLWLLFILVISFYIVNDWPNISRYLWGIVPRGVRLEVYYLTRRIDRTWNAFLRGQLILSAVIFLLTTLALLVLGLPQALSLGLLAGFLNLIPNLGPVLSSIPAIGLALLQGSTHFDISNLLFAVIILIAYIVIQQLESQILVPRIIGGSVSLHPAVVIIGALVGLSTVGILGIFLAAPTLASLRVIGGYAYRKLLDPHFVPDGIKLPPEIDAIPDPTERPLVPIKLPPKPGTPSALKRWGEQVNLPPEKKSPAEQKHDS